MSMIEEPKQPAIPESEKLETAGKLLGELIEKFEALEKVTPYLHSYWTGSGNEVSYRSKDAQALVEQIDVDLAWICKQFIKPYIEYEEKYSFLNDLGLIGTTPSEPGLYDGIRWALTRSGTSDSIHTVILFLKKGLRNVQRKQEQSHQVEAPEPQATPEAEPPAIDAYSFGHISVGGRSYTADLIVLPQQISTKGNRCI